MYTASDRRACGSQTGSPTHAAPLVIYAKAKWKSDCDRALRRAIDCDVDNTSGFKCPGPINTTKGLGRWIQTKAFFPLIYFYFSFLCRAIRDVWPINSSIHHASTRTHTHTHSAIDSLRSALWAVIKLLCIALTYRKVCVDYECTRRWGITLTANENTSYYTNGYSVRTGTTRMKQFAQKVQSGSGKRGHSSSESLPPLKIRGKNTNILPVVPIQTAQPNTYTQREK